MATPRNVRTTGVPRLLDPLLGFKFIVSWGGRPVAGVTRVGALKKTVEVVSYGNDPAPLIPGQVSYEPLTLERGLIIDVEFDRWANKVWFYENSAALGEQVSLNDFRMDITIQICNQAGQVTRQFLVMSCWPSEYSAMTALDAGDNAVALETMTLQNEGWQRDDAFRVPGYPAIEHPTAG